MSLWEALEMPCDVFLICYKNWLIDRLMATEEGREYLDTARRYKQTKLDKAGLQRLMGRMRGEET